jgi:hypothetical protein
MTCTGSGKIAPWTITLGLSWSNCMSRRVSMVGLYF